MTDEGMQNEIDEFTQTFSKPPNITNLEMSEFFRAAQEINLPIWTAFKSFGYSLAAQNRWDEICVCFDFALQNLERIKFPLHCHFH